jgi:hypothetical protein
MTTVYSYVTQNLGVTPGVEFVIPDEAIHFGTTALKSALFNLPYVPPVGTTLTSAYLMLNFAGSTLPPTDIVKRVEEAWTEATTGVGWDPDDLTDQLASTPTLHVGTGYYQFDLTAYVQDLIDGVHTNYGVMVTPETPKASYPAHDAASRLLPGYGSAPLWVLKWEASGGGGDTEDPVVSITAPADPSTIDEDTTLTATVTDNVGVDHAEAFLGSVPLGTLTSAPWQWTISVDEVANGTYVVTVNGYDAAGNVGTDTVTVTVAKQRTVTAMVTKDVEATSLGEWNYDKTPFYLRSSGETDPTKLLFDCPYVPPSGALVASAYLKVFCDEGTWSVGTPLVLSVYRGPAEWSNMEELDYAALGLVAQLELADWGTLTKGAISSIDLTDYMQDLVDGTYENYGVVLVVSSGDGYAAVTSCDYGWGSRAPKWEVTYIANPPTPDTSAPTVSIIAPVVGVDIAGPFTLRATITDDVGVGHAEAFVDGVSQGAITGHGGGSWEWLIDTTSLTNGAHAVTVKAWDAAGNMGQASTSIDLYQGLDLATKIIYTKQMTPAAFADSWRSTDNLELAIEIVEPPQDLVSLNPALRHNLEVAVGVPGTTADWSTMTVVPLQKSHGFASLGATCRWALRARPQLSLTSWASGMTDLLRLRYGDDGLLVLTADAIYAFADGVFTELVDLSAYGTPLDFVPWNGKIVVSFAASLVFFDLDTGEEDWAMDLPTGVTAFSVLESYSDDLWVACTSNVLLKLSETYDLVKYTTVSQVAVLQDCTTGLLAGCSDGNVLLYPAATLSYTAPAAVHKAGLVEGTTILVGTTGQLFHSAPTWGLEASLDGFTEVRGIAASSERAYVGGDGPMIWVQVSDGVWERAFSLADATAVNDMLTVDDVIYVATSSATDARIFRLEEVAETENVCGVDKPNFRFKVLRRAE